MVADAQTHAEEKTAVRSAPRPGLTLSSGSAEPAGGAVPESSAVTRRGGLATALSPWAQGAARAGQGGGGSAGPPVSSMPLPTSLTSTQGFAGCVPGGTPPTEVAHVAKCGRHAGSPEPTQTDPLPRLESTARGHGGHRPGAWAAAWGHAHTVGPVPSSLAESFQRGGWTGCGRMRCVPRWVGG